MCEQAYTEIISAYQRLCQRLGADGEEDVRINGERNDSGSTPMKIIPAYNDFRRILGKLF